MKRGKPLRADPDKVREFVQRGRVSGSLARGVGLARKGRSRPRTPRAARIAALDRTQGRCACCGARAAHVHHVLPVREWPDLVGEPDNLVGLCTFHHELHESASLRLNRACLPPDIDALAARAGKGRRTGITATAFVKRTYPPPPRGA